MIFTQSMANIKNVLAKCYSMTCIKGPTLFFKLSQWLYRVSNLACTKKTVWTRINFKQYFCNFEYLGLQKRLNILGSEIFRGFEEKTRFHQVRETERESMEWDSEMTQTSLFLSYFWNWSLHFNSLPLFPPTKLIQK